MDEEALDAWAIRGERARLAEPGAIQLRGEHEPRRHHHPRAPRTEVSPEGPDPVHQSPRIRHEDHRVHPYGPFFVKIQNQIIKWNRAIVVEPLSSGVAMVGQLNRESDLAEDVLTRALVDTFASNPYPESRREEEVSEARGRGGRGSVPAATTYYARAPGPLHELVWSRRPRPRSAGNRTTGRIRGRRDWVGVRHGSGVPLNRGLSRCCAARGRRRTRRKGGSPPRRATPEDAPPLSASSHTPRASIAPRRCRASSPAPQVRQLRRELRTHSWAARNTVRAPSNPRTRSEEPERRPGLVIAHGVAAR
ncbi:hypothetical protein Q5P01_000310 [Channa striata]|uniref:Uncharacterized protein n=1 Tax=Channa striata TaxID=64152 RepID=A0AA88IDN0_CHASR|nr:hypothetical protein Q5P01_000310 [Channa striata]